MWSDAQLCHAAAAALGAEDAALRAEQAVYGLDALDEIALHPVLARGLAAEGFLVVREHPYPGEVSRRPGKRERERCDLVLGPDPDAPLLDPVAELLAVDAAEGTLFEPIAESLAPAGAYTEAGEAYWLEVKALAQHAYVEGVPVPNARYATELVGGMRTDLVKLARDPHIERAGVLTLLFCEDRRIAEHDLCAAVRTLLDNDLPAGSPEIEYVEIEERAGNACCAVCLTPVRL